MSKRPTPVPAEDAMAAVDEDDGRRVCGRCVAEDVLSAEIRKLGRRGRCDYCGRDRRGTITIAALARRVDPVFRSIVGTAREEFVMRGGHPAFEPNGESPSFLLNEMLEAEDEEIGRDLVRELHPLHAWDVHEGGYDYYDDESESYTIQDADAGPLKRRWNEFCEGLKKERRFFIEDGVEFLDEILRPLVDGSWPHGGAIRTIGTEHEQREVFRARLANDDGSAIPIFEQRFNQLGAPRPGLAGAGRMNAPGISVFYGAFDQETCVAELRVPVGGAAIVGRFEIIRPLVILDLTRLLSARRKLSYFEPDFEKLRSYESFLHGFHDEIKKAVMPGQEALEYLPTQVVAEYLWARLDPAFDGIVFGSSQISGQRYNLALFPHAAIVEGAATEQKRAVNFSYVSGPDEDDEDRPEELRVFFDPLPPPPAQKPKRWQGVLDDEDDWFSDKRSTASGPAVPAPALRLTEVAKVEATSIRYSFNSSKVTFEDWNDEDF